MPESYRSGCPEGQWTVMTKGFSGGFLVLTVLLRSTACPGGLLAGVLPGKEIYQKLACDCFLLGSELQQLGLGGSLRHLLLGPGLLSFW